MCLGKQSTKAHDVLLYTMCHLGGVAHTACARCMHGAYIGAVPGAHTSSLEGIACVLVDILMQDRPPNVLPPFAVLPICVAVWLSFYILVLVAG